MKKLTLALAAIAFASVANAGIKLDVRSDYQNKAKGKAWSGATDTSTTSTQTEPSSSQNFVNAAEVSLSSKISDSVSVSGKLLTTTTNPNSATDKNYAALGAWDYAYVTHAFAEGMSLDFGKIALNNGGFENLDGIDDFNNSLIKAKNMGGTEFSDTTTYSSNAPGMGLNYTMGAHKMGLQAVNAESLTNTRHSTGLWYHGTFDTIQARVSYFTGEEGSAGALRETNDLSVGARGTFGAITATLDYLQSTDVKESTGTSGLTDNSVTSTLLDLTYAMGTYTPFFGYEMSEYKTAGNKAASRTNMNLGAKIAVSEGFAYHVAYSATADKYDAALGTPAISNRATTADNRIIAGVRFSADLLK